MIDMGILQEPSPRKLFRSLSKLEQDVITGFKSGKSIERVAAELQISTRDVQQTLREAIELESFW